MASPSEDARLWDAIRAMGESLARGPDEPDEDDIGELLVAALEAYERRHEQWGVPSIAEGLRIISAEHDRNLVLRATRARGGA